MSLFNSFINTPPTATKGKKQGSRKAPSKKEINQIIQRDLALGAKVNPSILTVAQRLYDTLDRGITKKYLKDILVEIFGGTDAQGLWDWKKAYEALEVAQVLWVRKVHRSLSLPILEGVLGGIPTHTKRSEESVTLQQFSTPLTLAHLVGQAAMIEPGDVVLEPSAGTGMLAVWAQVKKAKLILNELSEARREILKEVFPEAQIFGHDASYLDDLLPEEIRPDVVVMNPPFSAAPKIKGRYDEVTINHIRQGLYRLKEGGRLVTITADWFSPTSHKWSEPIAKLPGTVRFSVPIEGKTYYKHGTTIETRLTVIDKGQGDTCFISDDHQSLAGLAKLIAEYVPARCQPATVEPNPKVIAIESARRHKPKSSPRTTTPKTVVQSKVEASSTEPMDFGPLIDVEYEVVESWNDNNSNGIYESYSTGSIRIKNAKPHPSALVESAAMSAIACVAPSYVPRLPEKVIKDGLLSDAQLLSVILAGNAHESYLPSWYTYDEDTDCLELASKNTPGARQYRGGWFLGDNTGTGKGRQVAGVLLDNWHRGRKKAVWFSMNQTLLQDAKRDWEALGGNPNDVVPLNAYNLGSEVILNEGILFVTYATLRGEAKDERGSRLDQIVNWLGRDSDAVIVFDESHAMANAVEEKGDRGYKDPSKQALAGLKLQRLLPNTRVMYVSATGATKLHNLAYLERLGLWNSEKLPFYDSYDFLSSVTEGGIPGLEVVARDLKRMGLYLARSISFEGVQYEILNHILTDAQREMYNTYAKAYEVIHQNIQAALEATGLVSSTGKTNNGRAKSQIMSKFEGSKQRFFNHLLTSIKCLTLIEQMKQDLEQGKSVVIQLVSTDEAMLDRRLKEIPVSEWEDLNVDITPREYLIDYLISAFPIHRFEEVTHGKSGKVTSQLMKDEDGNLQVCQEAVRKRDALVERVLLLPPLHSALDQIIHEFGHENVAEVTGRSKRIIKVIDERGERMCVQKRSSSANLAESQAFMDEQKRILVFSKAGGCGRSYHADRSCKNQQERVHYVVEFGWQADEVIQGLGRTHRSNQAQPPVYRVIVSDVRGEVRFASTIARRLDELGALTKGERRTGNQGLFREEDNLESGYAKRALRLVFNLLYRNKIEEMSLAEFERVSGLELSTEEGGLRAELPQMKQFLNRVLAMRLDYQEVLFREFNNCIASEIEKAKEQGTYEVGLQTLNAHKLEVVNSKELYRAPRNGLTSYIVELKRIEKNQLLSAEDAVRLAKTSGGHLARNSSSGNVAVVLATTSFYDHDGTSHRRVRLTRPHKTDKMRLSKYQSSNWSRISEEEFRLAWQHQMGEQPEFIETTEYLITGALLPIWKRLDSSQMRIYRAFPENSQPLLGRLVSEAAMSAIANSFNLDYSESFDVTYERIMSKGGSVELAEGIKVKRSIVEGEYRLELLGIHNPGLLKQLKDEFNVFGEFINHQLRIFIPMNDNVVSVLEGISALFDTNQHYAS